MRGEIRPPTGTVGPVSHAILTETETGVAIAVWVVPGSSRSQVDGPHGDRLKVRVSSPPEGGRANDEVAELLARLLGAEVTLAAGMRGRAKVFEVNRMGIGDVRAKLGL